MADSTVSPANMNGWYITNSDATASTTFVTGPGTPPAGSGSAQMQIGADGDQYTILRTDAYSGTLLSSITTLTYSTYVQNNNNGQAPVLSFELTDGNKLYFEPVYQTGAYSGDSVPDQCSGIPNCVALNTWQGWNAEEGGWWDNNGYKGANSGPPVFTLADFETANPTATIAGVRILSGGGAGAWDNFLGNADDLTIGVNGVNTTYDFEPNTAASPEPASLALLGCGLLGVALASRRKLPRSK